MDSVAKSTTVGRISGPVAWIIAIILAKYFDVSVEGAEYDALTQIVGQALVYLFAAYGTVTPIISKIREKKAVCK